jgi:hypothetical protein
MYRAAGRTRGGRTCAQHARAVVRRRRVDGAAIDGKSRVAAILLEIENG